MYPHAVGWVEQHNTGETVTKWKRKKKTKYENKWLLLLIGSFAAFLTSVYVNKNNFHETTSCILRTPTNLLSFGYYCSFLRILCIRSHHHSQAFHSPLHMELLHQSHLMNLTDWTIFFLFLVVFTTLFFILSMCVLFFVEAATWGVVLIRSKTARSYIFHRSWTPCF